MICLGGIGLLLKLLNPLSTLGAAAYLLCGAGLVLYTSQEIRDELLEQMRMLIMRCTAVG